MGCSKFIKIFRKIRFETVNGTQFFYVVSSGKFTMPSRNVSNGIEFVSHFFKAIVDIIFRFSRPFFGKWNWLVIVKMVNVTSGRNLPVLNCSYLLPKAWTNRFVHVNGKQPWFCTMRREKSHTCDQRRWENSWFPALVQTSQSCKKILMSLSHVSWV